MSLFNRTETFYKDDGQTLDGPAITRFIGKACLYTTLLVLGLVIAWGLVGPQLKLYSARTQKQAIIAEANAQAEAELARAERRQRTAVAEADARRTEAEGIRDAQETIASSLTPEYIQWFFIDRLDDIDGQIVYVPTEGAVPITEAGRTAGGR